MITFNKRFAVAVFTGTLLSNMSLSAPVYPLKASPNNHYLVGQDGTPFLIKGDSPQDLFVRLSIPDVAAYLHNRANNGYNAVWVNLLCDQYTGGNDSDGSMLDGTKPFTSHAVSQWDLTTPNEAYFAHADIIINMCATNGICVLLDPIETGGWLNTLQNNGTNRCFSYGQWLGRRYKTFPNIVWMSGNDFQTWQTTSDDNVVRAVALGIQTTDSAHLQTSELSYIVSSSLDDATWTNILGLNAAYTYNPMYDEILKDYQRRNFLPAFLVEGNYEGEHNGNTDGGTPLNLRLQEWWTMTSGACGQLYGSQYWRFQSGWQANLNSPGSVQFGYLQSLMSSKPWYNLIPDTNHTMLSSGYGVYGNQQPITSNTYATGARTPDGTFGVVYTPVSHTLVVDMSKFSGPVTTRWYDPSAGTFVAISGSPFNNAGSNSFSTPGSNKAGDADWVLLMESQSGGTFNSAPTITTIADQTTTVNIPAGPIPFTVTDAETPASNLTLGRDSSNPSLLPTNNIVFGGSSNNRTVTLIPATNATGVATITITVSDGTNTTSTQFSLSVGTPNSSLVAAYSFNEGSGSVVTDVSGQGNKGTLNGATWTSSGKYGSALSFNGTSSLVTINNSSSLQLTAGMTLEAWVNPSTATSGWRDVIYKGNDNFYLEGSSASSGTPATGGTFSPGPLYGTAILPANTWAHLAATYDGATQRLYVNGVQVATRALSGAMAVSSNPLQIGGDSMYGQYFAGAIDEVRIYNVALTAAQIQSDMNTPIGSDTQSPTPPATLTATAVSGSQINLSWAASTDNLGVTGYLIERQGGGVTTFTQIGTSTTTTFNDAALAAGTAYSYQVRATDAAGNKSGYSPIASATTQATDTQAPSAPTTLTATSVSGSQINLSWTASTDNVGVTGYLVERQGGGVTTFTQIGSSMTTTCNNTALAAGTTYSYQVRATDAAGNKSGYSPIASATTQAPDTQAPSAPATLTATSVSGSQINLSWAASTDNVGVTSYLIERQGGGVTTFTQIGTSTTTTFNNTALAAGTTYSYQVRATDAAGNKSGYSPIASATTTGSANGLVAAYGFNEGSGTTTADASGNGNLATLSGATWAASGKYGSALVFNGSSALVTINNSTSLQLSTAMTLEAWVKASMVTSAWRDVIYKGNDNYYLEGTSVNSGVPASGGTFNAGPIYATATLSANTWTHLAATFDGVMNRLYVNGALVATKARTNTIATSTNPLQIGGDTVYGQYFQGTIDEVRIYNRALSTSEIQSDMNSPISSASSMVLTTTGMAVVSENLSFAQAPAEVIAIDLHNQNIIGVTIKGEVGLNYALEASSDLLKWTQVDLQRNLTGTILLAEPRTTNSIRYYRAVPMR